MDQPHPNEGARRLVGALDEQDLTPYALDKEAGWSIGQTSKYLRGDRKPDTPRSWYLFQRFGIEPPLWDEPSSADPVEAA